MAKKVGPATWYDQDEIDEALAKEGPGYSDDQRPPGCKDLAEDGASMLLALLALGLLLARLLLGSGGLVRAWVVYCHQCQARATMGVPFLNIGQALAIKWAQDGGWQQTDEGQWLCPKCARQAQKERGS